MTQPADPHYLKDIQGNLKEINLDDLIKSEGLKGLLPDSALNYHENTIIDEADALHQYQCNLDRDAKSAQTSKCADGRYLSEIAASSARKRINSWGFIQIGAEPKLWYDEPSKTFKNLSLPPRRTYGNSSKYDPKGLSNTIVGAGRKVRVARSWSVDNVIDDRSRSQDDKNFAEAVEGKDGKSIGHRAILFDEHGRPIKGANAIRDKDEAIALSSRLPAERANDGTVAKKIQQGQTRSTKRNSANKHGIGQTNDVLGGLAALGGVTGVIGALAVLMPLHFVTSAITFLTSITTFLTNVNNAATTYLSVVDGVLSVFGQKGSVKAMKGLMASTVDNVFGKENLQDAKNIFASTINTIAVSTKLLEKIQIFRSGMNNLFDALAGRLGLLNNSLADNGLIPAEYMATSKAIENYVDERSKAAGNENLEENITALTKELETQAQSKEALEKEKEAADKVRAKLDKDINDVKTLVDATKTNVDAVKEKDL